MQYDKKVDLSVNGLGLYGHVRDLCDFNQLVQDAVVQRLAAFEVNFDRSRGLFVEPRKRVGREARYAVHVAIEGNHRVLQVVIPGYELELVEGLEHLVDSEPFLLD